MTAKTKSRRPKLTEEERAARRQEVTDAAVADLHAGLAKLVESDTWKAMLRTAAAFHTYSPHNYLMIWSQALARGASPEMPVASFNRWRSLDRRVIKGEKAYRVWAPIKKKVEDEETGEEREKVVTFKLVPVFTYDQTEGEPLPQVQPVLPEGDGPEGAWDALVALAEADGYRVTREPPRGGEQGYTEWSKRRINVSAPEAVGRAYVGMSGAMLCKTLAHEIAHVRLGHEELGATYRLRDVRGRAEVEAESVAYVVMHALGLTVDEYSLDYVATWAQGDLDAIKETTTRVLKVARAILADLEPAPAE